MLADARTMHSSVTEKLNLKPRLRNQLDIENAFETQAELSKTLERMIKTVIFKEQA